MIWVSQQISFWGVGIQMSWAALPSQGGRTPCFLLKEHTLATLESNDGVGVNVGNVRGAIMMMKITNDYMAGCGGLRTLCLAGCG